MRNTCSWVAVAALLGGCALYVDGGDDDGIVDDTPDDPPPAIDDPVDDPAPLATDRGGIHELAADDLHVYWVENGAFDYTSELRRMPRAGGAIETLYSTNAAAHGLALGDDAAFLVTTLGGSGNYSGTVVRVPKDGTAPTTLTTAFNPTSIAVDGDWVYYNEAASPEGAIRRVATTGGDPELVVDVADNPYDLAAQAGVLYYSEMNVGRMMRVVPGEQPTELAAGWIGTVWMAVDATHVYFCGCETGECAEPRLYRVPLDGGETELLATGTRNEGKIAVTDGAVLWGEWFVPLDGTEPTKLLHSGTDGMLVIGVAAAGDDLYAADYYSGAIYRF